MIAKHVAARAAYSSGVGGEGHRVLRNVVIGLDLFVGVTALIGGIYALTGAKSVPREWLRGTFFQSYKVPGLVLLVVVGGSMLTAVTMLLTGVRVARIISLEAGVVLIGWILVQMAMIGYRSPLQPLYLILGLAVVVMSMALPVPG
ncbi:MAG: hypothetical protein H5T84_00340 [Thermoleophilia bacterium]|nr:hypothetical protein [Thermoleophilia bacterium]